MKVSFNWLRQYVDIKEKPQDAALKFTMHSAEVEEVKPQAEFLDNIIVGQVAKIRKHPHADKLQLADTFIAPNRTVQIVCGGSNLREGMWVAVALVGAKVRWHGVGEPVVLERAEIRGEHSEGMICSLAEINLGKNAGSEIIDLEKFAPNKIYQAGMPLAGLLDLNDYIIEIDNKSLTHRSDLFCHIGLAREYAAFSKRKLKLPKLKSHKAVKNLALKVEVKDKKLCPRYLAAVMDNIVIKESPAWMQARLSAAGMRPINNVVDIANYVMLEYGNPLHTFDYEKIINNKIIIRKAKNGETLETLDGKIAKLTAKDLIIADSKKSIALAGVIGGLNSEVARQTKTIIIESANFHKVSVRKTAARHDLRTEAVIRFEKGLGLNLPDAAMNRAIDLFAEYANGELAGKIIDQCSVSLKEKKIKLDLTYLNQLAGIDINPKQVINILRSLEIKVKANKDSLIATIPLFRTDLNIQEDLIEEVARIYGYKNIPLTPIGGGLKPVFALPDLKWGNIITNKLADYGFIEVMNYSFYGDKELKKSMLKTEDHIQMENPLSAEQKYLRTTLLPHLLSNLKKNLDNNFENIKLFEFGHVYYPNAEMKIVGGIMTSKKKNVFYTAKGYLQNLLRQLNIGYEFFPINRAEEKINHYWQMFVKESDAKIMWGNKIIGTLSLVHRDILDNFGIKNEVAFFNFDLALLARLANNNKVFNMIAKFPPVTIDLAIIVAQDYSFLEIKEEILKTDDSITSLQLFDVYQGGKIGADKKSLAMHLIFQNKERTLSMSEIEKRRAVIMKVLNNKFNAIIRDK